MSIGCLFGLLCNVHSVIQLCLEVIQMCCKLVLAQLLMVISWRMRKGQESSKEHAIPVVPIVSSYMKVLYFVALVLSYACFHQHCPK